MLGGAVRRVLIAALAGVVVVGGVGCGGDDEEEGSTGSSVGSTTAAPSTTLDEETGKVLDEETGKVEAATRALLDYYDAYQQATAEPVDPEHSHLQALVTGEHRLVVTRNLEERHAKGEAVRLPPSTLSSHDIRSAELQPDGSVEIVDCQVDDSIVYQVETGEVVDDDVVTKLVVGLMSFEGGAWKLAFSEISETWPGVGACDG
jgi:hypothetical protein